ncbi:hypothetical protein E2320_021152 [Naja naja]|nr:hypothetical protein E2320_021152 [Naja naja]
MEKQEPEERELEKAALEDRRNATKAQPEAQEANRKKPGARGAAAQKSSPWQPEEACEGTADSEEKKLLNQADKRNTEAILKGLVSRRRRAGSRRAAMEGSLNKAQENYEQLIEKRNQELREEPAGRPADPGAKLAAERKTGTEGHLEPWHKHLRGSSNMLLRWPRSCPAESSKVVQNRLEKEKMQKVNKRKVEECEDIRRREILLSIEKKLERSEQICKEKKTVLESAKSVARASFHVREKVREEMNMRTFDKMAFEAELQATLVKK